MTQPIATAIANTMRNGCQTMAEQSREELPTHHPSPTPLNVGADQPTMAMDGPTAAELQERHRQADHASGRWCGECRWNSVETPICCYGPDDVAPVESVTGHAPVGRWIAPRGGYVEDRDDAESDAAFRDGLAAIRERGARTDALLELPRPVAAVVACPEVLVVACARAQWDAHRVEALKRFPSSRIPEWDDDLGWSMGREWVHGRECDEMRERLAVLWPVIVEHLGASQ